MIEQLKSGIYIVVGLLLLWLAGASLAYRHLYQTTQRDLSDLRGSVKAQNDEAARKLKDMTAERDAKQTLLDQQAKDRNQADDAAQTEIGRLNDQLRTQPVRVRIVAAPSGACGGGAAGQAAAPAQAGAADTGATYGLLPDANSGRLAVAMKEVETLSAAYTSCRATLIPETQ